MAFLTERDRQYKTPEDICAHVGDEYENYCGAIVPPIYQNSLFVLPTEVNGVTQTDYVYTRVSNPTIDIAERKIAALEGADGALCFSSGMAAISSAILHFVRANCHMVLVASAYGGTMQFVREYLNPRMGVSYTLVQGEDIEEIRAAIRPETRLIYVESPSSAVLRMQDLEAVAALAKEHGIGTVVDNTYATPLHQQPLKYGIDISCHTASKYLGGHSDLVAGAIAARREIIESIQNNERLMLGSNMDPHQAWLLIRGMRTLPVRLRQHGENGRRVAEFLEKHPRVGQVFYPGLDSYPQKELFDKYISGTNGLISFTVKGTKRETERFAKSLHFFQCGCSWGGFESLCAVMGESDVTKIFGQPENLVRIHVGMENVETLIEDLAQAFEHMVMEK